MKGFNCPNCGKKQSVKLDTPSRATLPCPECGRTLTVKMDKGKWSVLIQEAPDGELSAQPSA